MPEMKQVINCETGECEMVPLTKAEQSQRTKDIAAAEAEQQEREQEAQDQDAKVSALKTKLGLTDDEWELLCR